MTESPGEPASPDAGAPAPRTGAPKLRPIPEAPTRGRGIGWFAEEVVLSAQRRIARAGLVARAGWLRARARRAIGRAPRPLRLCLGSGAAPLPGWVNVDLDAPGAVRLDLRFPLPVPDASVEFVYSEHVIEHLTLEAGVALMRECRRVLVPDGVLRLATPDLANVVRAYEGDWRAQDWVNWKGHEWIDTRARMLNLCFHGWGHQHLYDHEELAARLRAAGFGQTRRCALGESPVPALQGLETRLDSLLVVEAWGSAGGRKKT